MAPYNKNSKKIKVQIHCPVNGCLFAVGSERHFTEKKFLNQHIAKVHAEKKFPCAKCNKSFGLDWWRKHHEKTCGMVWKCDCGLKYNARESLLTHIRRTQHKLPDSIISSYKTKQNKATAKTTDSPLIVLIQPIIQNITCTQHHQTSLFTPRRILPKTTQPLFLTLPISMSPITPAPTPNNVSPVILSHTKENSFNSMQPLNTFDRPVVSPLPNQLVKNAETVEKLTTNDKYQKTIATQTIDDTGDTFAKHLQSQASQCSRRRPKSLKVGIESHTQTAESAVVKIKKKRSRRKSVAITTETSMLTDQIMSNENNSVWPGFKDFVLQHGDGLGNRLFKNSASTQTIMVNNKTLCDSETLTDQELFKFSWEKAMKEVNKTDKCNTEFQMMADMNRVNTLTVGIDNSNLQDLNIFSSDTLNNFPESKTSKLSNENQGLPIPVTLSEPFTSNVSSDCHINIHKDSNENCSVFSVFGNCDKSIENKVSLPPTLSDIHTQTMASAVLDYNLLTNMETQTTDDFNFSYLEFSDTETQTPWEDLPSMDDSPMQADQLSIEIQTDFSSFDASLNLDFNDLINSVDMQNMMSGCSSKETAGVNTETQTLDKFYFPQFTNSESQTLDMADFVFDS